MTNFIIYFVIGLATSVIAHRLTNVPPCPRVDLGYTCRRGRGTKCECEK